MITVHRICWSNVSLGTCLYLKAFKLEVGSVLKSDKYHSNVQSLERRVLTAQNLQSTISSAEHKRVSSFPPIEIGLRFLSSYNSDFFQNQTGFHLEFLSSKIYTIIFQTKLDLVWNCLSCGLNIFPPKPNWIWFGNGHWIKCSCCSTLHWGKAFLFLDAAAKEALVLPTQAVAWNTLGKALVLASAGIPP